MTMTQHYRRLWIILRRRSLYKGKVRELYDLGEHYLIVVTDRI